jgi:hypothetical protein
MLIDAVQAIKIAHRDLRRRIGIKTDPAAEDQTSG